jgi:hypothetical protein
MQALPGLPVINQRLEVRWSLCLAHLNTLLANSFHSFNKNLDAPAILSYMLK